MRKEKECLKRTCAHCVHLDGYNGLFGWTHECDSPYSDNHFRSVSLDDTCDAFVPEWISYDENLCKLLGAIIICGTVLLGFLAYQLVPDKILQADKEKQAQYEDNLQGNGL